MSRLTPCLFAAILIGVAPRLGAQATPQQAKATIAPATVTRMLAVKKKPKGSSYRAASTQRAASYSNLVVVTGPNGERRYARAPKSSK